MPKSTSPQETPLLLAPTLCALVMSPFGCARLFRRSATFDEGVTKLIDPLTTRIGYMGPFEIITENLGGALTIIGFIASMYSVFSSTSQSAQYLENDERISAYDTWAIEFRDAPMGQLHIAVQLLYGLWAETGFHAAAVAIYLLRLFEFTMILPESSYLLLTIVFAAFPILNFALIFLMILTGFAIVCFAQFGATYPQFGSLGKSLWALCLYTFGFGDQSHAEDLVQPFVEEDALGLQLTLLAFNILVVTLLLNMFTTIVINAYSLSVEKTATHSDVKKLKATFSYQMKRLLGYEHETQEEVALLGQRPGRVFLRMAVAREEDFDLESPGSRGSATIADYKSEMQAMADRMNEIMDRIQKMPISSKEE